jgi:hypothetical protein
MSVTGFWVDREAPGVMDEIVQIRGVDGIQYSEGDAIMIATTATDAADTTHYAGLAIQIPAQTSPAQYIFLAMVSDKSYLRPPVFDEPTAAYEYLELIEVNKTSIVMNTQFPLATFDGVATNTNAVANEIVFTGAGSTNDFTGGQVYVNELAQQFTILDDVVAAGAHTLTVAPAPPVTISTGYTLRVVPWGPGYTGGVKFQATNPQQGISVAVADKTGGPVFIYGVDLGKRIAYVKFDSALI